ncbi:MAG: protein kinase [Terriglobales bacterium]
MPLTIGSQLGPYEILALAGAGGMGEVYKARDTRLDRVVAIKVLPAHLSADPDLKQRLEREAKSISALQHPYICTLFDVGSQDGVDFLVMEFLEGETLAVRVRKGAMPIDQVLKTGIEIADALDRAHRSGILHRDLKPGNIMLTKAGAKLMDFGLAKASGMTSAASASSLTAAVTSPASPVTQAGTIVGTFQYMSPEQIEGKDADPRSDIFAYGAVLYEMATGKPAFEGKSQLSVMSAILEKEPEPISATQPLTPPAFEHVVKRALAKDPDERWQTAGDIRSELKWVSESGSHAAAATQQLQRPALSKLKHYAPMLAVAGWVVALALLAWALRPGPGSKPVLWTEITAPLGTQFSDLGESQHVIISPDATHVAFIAMEGGKRTLWVRELSKPAPRRLAGTEGAYYPFWAANGGALGFFADGKMKRIDVANETVQVLAETQEARGGTWNANGDIVFAPNIDGPLMRVSENGGQVTAVTKMPVPNVDRMSDRLPYFLPDGKTLMFVRMTNEGGQQRSRVFTASLGAGEPRMLLEHGSNVAFANGQLFFMKDGNLMAQEFDAGAAKLRGTPQAVAAQVDFYSQKALGNFSVSRNGTVLLRKPSLIRHQLQFFDARGAQVEEVGEISTYYAPKLSPSGDRFVVTLYPPGNNTLGDLWMGQSGRKALSRITFEPSNYSAVWARRSKRLAYVAGNGFDTKVFIAEEHGAQAKKVLQTNVYLDVTDWTPDETAIIGTAQESDTSYDIVLIPVDGGPRTALIGGPFDQVALALSPDGKYLAYLANESRRWEVYVSEYPAGRKWQISTEGAKYAEGNRTAQWSADAKKLYFLNADGSVMEAGVRDGQGFRPATPRVLFRPARPLESLDLSPNGRFLALMRSGADIPQPLTLLQNWKAKD